MPMRRSVENADVAGRQGTVAGMASTAPAEVENDRLGGPQPANRLMPPMIPEPLRQANEAMMHFWLGPLQSGDEDISQRMGEALDRSLHYLASRRTLGLSPMAVAEAYFDWLIHLAASPGKQLQLAEKALRKSARLAHYAAHCALQSNGAGPCIEPLAQDKRFRGEAWQQWPFNIIHQSFLLQQQWWHNAVTGIPGMSKLNQRRMDFLLRQPPVQPAPLLEARVRAGSRQLRDGRHTKMNPAAQVRHITPERKRKRVHAERRSYLCLAGHARMDRAEERVGAGRGEGGARPRPGPCPRARPTSARVAPSGRYFRR